MEQLIKIQQIPSMLNICSYSQKPQHFKKINWLVVIMMCLFFLPQVIRTQFSYQLMITTSTSMASNKADYTFEILQEDDITVTSTTNVQIVLPVQYQGVMNDGSFICYVSTWVDGLPIPTISCLLSGLTFTINGLFTSLSSPLLVPSFTFYGFVINQITNPMYAATTAAFTGLFIETTTNAALFTFSTNFGSSGIQISESILACSISSSPTTTTSSPSTMIVSVTPIAMIPLNTTLTIQMLKYWPANAFNTTTIMSSINCQSGTNTSANIQCSMVIKPTAIQIIVTNIVSQEISGGVVFYINSIINPPTIQPQNSVDIIAKKDGTKLMGRCSGNKMNGITAINFLTASYSVTNSSVNSITSAFLLFKISSVVITSDTIKITLPSSISAVSSLSQLIITNGNYTNYSPSVTYFPSSQTTLIVTTGASSNPGSSIEVQLYNIKNPPSQAVTDSIGLQLLRNGFLMQKLDIVSTPLQFKAKRANMLATLKISTTQIGVAADYTFALQLKNQISSSGQGVVIIYFPTAFNASVTASSSCNPPCLSLDTTKAVISASSLNLTISSLSCSIQLLSILNPTQVGQTTSFWINTLYKNTNTLSIVDQITSGLSVVLTSRQISSVTLLTSSNIVYFYPTTYSFTAVNSNPIPAFSSILLLIPSAIVVGEAGVSCMLGTRAVPCSYNSTAHSITVTSLSTSSIGARALSTLSVSNLFNPTSTAPTSSFKFYIVNPYSQIIEHKESGIIFTATVPTQFSTISLQSNSVTNSDGNTSILISFSLNMQQGYVNNSLLLISMPAQISGISSISCLVVSPNLLSVSCTKSSSTIKARLSFNSLTAGDQVAFKIQYYINYPSIQPYSILLTLFTSTTEQFKVAQNTIINVNSQLSSLTVQSYSFSSTILSQLTVFTFSITPTYYGTDLAEVWVTLPQQFSLSTPSCSSIPPSLTCSIVGRVFKIAETASTYSWVLPLEISLSGILAPTFSPSTSITIETRSNTGYLMSRSTQPKFSTNCNLPCRTCLTTDLSSCLSCYSDPTLVSSKIILSGTQCVSACNNRQYYNNNTNQCDSCSSICQLCIDYSYCTSCPAGNYLDRVAHTCVSDCSLGFYKSNVYTCEACNSALFCDSCTNQHSCLTCLSGYFLYQNLCVQTCPAPITYSNSILNICQSCPTNCTKCSGSVTLSLSTVACTECTVGYLLDTSTTRCFQQCLVPGTVPSGNQCVSCQSPCLSCSLTPTNCTACDVSSPNKYFHNNRCLSLCPSLYYPSDSSYSCVLCTSPCQTCTSGSVNSCISCITSYYLLGSTCVQTCPNLYYNNVYRCSPCVSPCLNCLSELQCSSCISGRYLYGTNCVTTCDPGMTIINGNQCLVCAPSCRTCSTSSYCTSCYPTNYLFNGTCSITCVATTYPDNSQQLCLPCTAPCKDCSSSTYCITCINTALVIENGLCLAACTSPLIPVNSICTSCNSACSTCVNSITNCVICQSGYYFHSNLVGVNCVSNCLTGYIYDNRTTSGNYECLNNCPSSHYNTGLGTQCLPCDIGCQACTSSLTNCSLCISNYYLTALTSTCSQTCPTNSPYPTLYAVNTSSSYGVCEICNKTICNSCEFLHSCGTCPSGKILVYEGITSRINSTVQNKTCLLNCPTNYSYNNTQLLCLVSQSTNNSNTSTNSSSTISQSYKIIPNYLFSIVGACVLPVVAISKYQVPTTSLQISLYAIVIAGAAFALAHTLYFEVRELFYTPFARLLEAQNYVNVLGLNVQVDNPTTILAFLPVIIHILGTFVLLLGLACIRDYSLIPIIQQHPIFSIAMLILFFIQYKFIWILSSGMFGLEVTMVKYCKQKMVKLLHIITLIGIAELIMSAVYAVYIIILVVNVLNSSQTSRLLLSSSQLPNSVTFLHPYIQLVIFSGLGLFLSICLLLTNKSQYFIQQVPEINQTFFKEKQNLTKKTKLSENNQSMNELLSDKDAVFKRFNSDQILRDIDDAAMIVSVDQKQNDYLHDFGVTKVPTERSRLKSSKADESRLSKISKISKIKQVETAQVDIQANMDQLMLPYINEEQQIKTEHKQERQSKQIQGTNEKKQNQNEGLLNSLNTQQAQNNSKINKQIQMQQEKEVLKSQPSWSSFKLGNKHKYQLEQDRQYLGYVCTTQNGLKQEGWSGNTQIYDAQGDMIAQKITSKNPEHKINSQIERQSKTIMQFEEEEDILQSEDFGQQYQNNNQTKLSKQINNKQSVLKVIDHRHEESSGLDQISEQQMYNYHIKKENSEESRDEDAINNKGLANQQVPPLQMKRNQIFDMEEEEYEQEIDLSKQTQQLNSHINNEEKEYQQDNFSVLVQQYTERDKDESQEQDIANSVTTNKQSSQHMNKQLSNMSEQQEKVNLKTNRLFYLDETDKFNNEELLSQNLPSQYKKRIPSEESEAFTPFYIQNPSESDNHAVEQIESEFAYNGQDDNQNKIEQQKNNQGDENIDSEQVKNKQEENIIYDQNELGRQEQNANKDEQAQQKSNRQTNKQQSQHVKVDSQQDNIMQSDKEMSEVIKKSQKSEQKQVEDKLSEQKQVEDKSGEQKKEKQLKQNEQIKSEQVEQLNISVKKMNKNPESLLARLKGKRVIRQKNEQPEKKQFNESNSNNQAPLKKQSIEVKNQQIQSSQQLKFDRKKIEDKRQLNNGEEDEQIGQLNLDDKFSEQQSMVKVQLQEKSSEKSKKQSRNNMKEDKKIEGQNQENDNRIRKSGGVQNSLTNKRLNESQVQRSNLNADMKYYKQQRDEISRQLEVEQNNSIAKQISNGQLHQIGGKKIKSVAEQQKLEVDSLQQMKSRGEQQDQKGQQHKQKQNLNQDQNNESLQKQKNELKDKQQEHQKAHISTKQQLKEFQSQESNLSKEKLQRDNLIKVENQQQDNKYANKNNSENRSENSLKNKIEDSNRSKIIKQSQQSNSKDKQDQQIVENNQKNGRKEQGKQQRLNESIRQSEKQKQIKNKEDQVNVEINPERNLEIQGSGNKQQKGSEIEKPIDSQFGNVKRSEKKEFEEHIQQKSKNVSVDTPVKQNIGHDPKQEEGGDLKNVAMELLKSKHRSQRSQLPINLKRTQKITAKQKRDDSVFVQDTQHKSQFPFRNKKEQQRKIEIQYDDAEHFNQINEPNKKQGHDNDIIFKVPSEMGASLLIVDDDQPFHHQEDIILDIQQPQQKLSSQNGEVSQKEVRKQKGITFIEDLNQLDEMVKTPIRFSTKNVTKKVGTLQNDDAADTKLSDLIYNKRSTFIGENKVKQNKSSLGGIGQSKKARVQLTFGNRKGRNEKNVNVIYEEQDKDYDDHQSIKQTKVKKNIDLKDKRMATLVQKQKQKVSDQIAESNDKKPSTMLRGSFKKIGEMLMKGDRQA